MTTTSDNLNENLDTSNIHLNTQNEDESNTTSTQISEQNKTNKSIKPQNIVKIEDFLNLNTTLKPEKQPLINPKTQQSNVNIKKGLELIFSVIIALSSLIIFYLRNKARSKKNGHLE